MAKIRGRRVKKSEDSKNENQDIDQNYQDVQDKEQKDQSIDSSSTAFFGLVDSNELTYFHQAEQTLNLNTFSTPEESELFVNSVFEEARGKELKLVTNQICSKLMERLVLNSSQAQVYQLYHAFEGRFYDLSRQKFSSHVLETFLVRCAALIEKEMLSNNNLNDENDEDDEDDDKFEEISMEEMFIKIISEFLPHLKQMINDRYATHVLRIALLVMTGKELPSSTESNSILRSKKSKIARKMIEIKDSKDYQKNFQVPTSFKDELRKLLQIFNKNETCESLRELAINKVTSPVIQLFIQLEGIVDRDRTIWSSIFNGDNEAADPKQREKEGAFVEYLLSDQVGSHFLQNSIENQKVKSVERIYNSYMKEKLVKLAKRETTGVYVVECMMAKLKSTQQMEILDLLVPVMNELIVNNIDIGGSIIDCSARNDNYLKESIIDKFIDFFNKGNNNDDLFENILKLSKSTLFSTKDDWPTSEERRRALFFEKLIEYDQEKILHIAVTKILEFDEATLIKFCKHGVFSHIIENVLKLRESLNIVERKTLLNKLIGHECCNIVELACNSTASHIIDALWMFTFKLNMFKERIARTLLQNSEVVKSTIYGRMVWKNWNMELYTRKFNDWKWIVKEEEQKYEEEKQAKKKELEESNSSFNASGKRGRQGDNVNSDGKPKRRRR